MSRSVDAAPATEVEPEPVEAEQVFGAGLPAVRRYAADLAARGVELGLIGPLEPARLWTRHIVNCGLLADLLPVGARVADVGSGAGLPGLVLASARPDLEITLIEPMERRVAWLESETLSLALPRVQVVRARAEEYRGDRFDVVTARAVGALTTLLPATVPLVKPGGRLALMKGASVEAELAKAQKVVSRLGLTDVHVEVLGGGRPGFETRVLVATAR